MDRRPAGIVLGAPCAILRSMDHVPHPESHPEESGNPTEESPADILTPEEARVLGCLMEKAKTTPEHYPLTMNSLIAACNQKTNRAPVVEYNEGQVDEAMAGLRAKGLGLRVTMAGSRVLKFQHSFERAFPDLEPCGAALMAVLLLRGRQTLGELRSRTERMFHFDSLEDVQEALDDLVCYPPRQLVREIPAGGGHRVPTFVHLLAGEPGEESAETTGPATRQAVPATGWREDIEEQLAALRSEIESLRRDLGDFQEPIQEDPTAPPD